MTLGQRIGALFDPTVTTRTLINEGAVFGAFALWCVALLLLPALQHSTAHAAVLNTLHCAFQGSVIRHAAPC